MTIPMTPHDTVVPAPLHDLVVATMQRERIPGLSLAVVDRDGLRFAAGYGVADLSSGAPVTPTTAFLWFSMSKIVTATAALRLSDEGTLDLDAPVTDFLPEARGRTGVPRVRDLLDHTSGLGNPLPLRWVHPASAVGPDPRALLHRQLSRRRAFRRPPGVSARYSNVGYLALGEVVATAARMPFVDYVHRAVLEPLGMDATGYAYTDAPAAVGYVRGPAVTAVALRRILPAGIVGRRVAGRITLAPFYVDGPAYGGVVGDVLDAARFVRAHLCDGTLDGHRVLRSETAVAMREIDRRGAPFDHGLGWFRPPSLSGPDFVQHLGAGAGFRNVMRLYPGHGVGVVVMTNTTAGFPTEPLLERLAGVS